MSDADGLERRREALWLAALLERRRQGIEEPAVESGEPVPPELILEAEAAIDAYAAKWTRLKAGRLRDRLATRRRAAPARDAEAIPVASRVVDDGDVVPEEPEPEKPKRRRMSPAQQLLAANRTVQQRIGGLRNPGWQEERRRRGW